MAGEEQLKKHALQSELHKSNAEKWCSEKGLSSTLGKLVIETVTKALRGESDPSPPPAPEPTYSYRSHESYHYRDRAKERRRKGGRDDSSSTFHETASSSASTSLDQPVSGVGQKLIEKMGWEAGKGLGRFSQGIVNPIEASQRQSRVGLGSSASGSSGRQGERLDYREAAKRTLFQRFHELQ